MKNFLSFVVVFFCLGMVQIAQAATLCYGFTKVEGVRTNGVNIRAVYQEDTNIVLDTVSYHHPVYGDGYFHMSRSGTLPAGKYEVHFKYGSYFRNKVITYDPEIGPVDMGDVELVRVEYASNDTIIIIRNIQMEAIFWRQTGVIRDLTVKGHKSLLSVDEPGQIIFRDTLFATEYQQNNHGIVTDIDSSITPNQVRLVFEVDFQYHTALVKYTMDTLTLRWDNDVWLKSPPREERALRLDFSLPLLDKMNYAFWSDENAPFKIGDDFNREIGYRKQWCVLPAVILYDTILDYGLSLVCPFEVKKPALSFKLQKNLSADTFRVSYNYLRMGSFTGKHAGASLYLVPHKGDWRPGLDWMLSQYPEYFKPHPNSNVLEHEGRFFFGGYYNNEADMDTAKSYGVKWEEYYSHHPFFGLYAPQDRWQWMRIDDNNTTTTYYRWFINPGDINHNYGKARRMIDSFNLYGIGSYNYFNASEVWRKWVATGGDTFPFDDYLATRANGDTISGFPICWTMNPDTNLYPGNPHSWAVHIDSQIIAVLDSYPQAAGIFLDRDDYCEYDYAHNDSVSMIHTTPVYMLAFALEEINEHICREVHNRNKSIITNGPSCIEVCKNMDGIMTELYVPPVGNAQYLGLSRPMILFVIDTLAHETEKKDKSALYSGHFPSFERIIENPVERKKSRAIDRKYQPLFDLYKGKTWVLHPHALRLPAGIKGNIFRAVNNDLLIPMVDMEKSQLLPDPFIYNLQVKLAVPELDKYDHCYILSGDYIGPRWVVYDPGATVGLTVPEHMVASLIQLSPDPRYEYSLVSSPVLCRGKAAKFKLRVQNLDPENKPYTLSIITPFGNYNYPPFWLRQYDYRDIQYNFTVPESHPLGEDSFLVINTAPSPDDTTLFTNWTFEPVSLKLPTLFVRFPLGDSFLLTLVNNTADTMHQVRLGYKFTLGHGKMEWGPKSFLLTPYETKKIPIYLDINDTCGIIQIIATSNSDTVGTITKPVKRAMRPTPGDIFFDDFNSGEMSKEWDKWEPPEAWTVEDSSAKGSGVYSYHFATVGTGNTNWTNYRFQVNTRSKGSTNPYIQYLKSYLYFRVQNDTQYYRFGIKGDEPGLLLHRRDGDSWTKLGDYFFSPERDTWYSLGVKVQGNSIRCYLNGEEVIAEIDGTYSYGGIGIGVSEDYMTNYYDDVVVRPIPFPDTLFADNFDSGEMDSLWHKLQGIWSFLPEDPRFVRGSGSAHFATVAEGCDWTSYRYQVKTRIIGSEICPSLRSYIFFRVQDTLNFYRFGICSDGGLVLHKRVNGEWTLLARYSFEPRKNVWYNLKIEIQDSLIKGYLNDTLHINFSDTKNPFLNGGIGIGVLESEGMVVDYDDVLVNP